MHLKGNILSENKPISKGYIAHDAIYTTVVKSRNYRDAEQPNRGQELEMGKRLVSNSGI